MNNPVIYPYNSLLAWDDATSLTLSGSADSSAISVSAIDNGVSATAYYNATSNEWSYETTITGYTNSFVIISEDSLNNTASSYAYVEVDSPIIINTASSYNILNPSIEGRTNEITLRLEASYDSINYSPSGFIRDAFTTDFIYNNFRFHNPTQTYSFIGRDIGGYCSSSREITLNYLMNDPLIYTEIEDPYDSRTVSVAGSADHDVTGFIYSPDGGQFTSGRVETSSGGYTEWAYKFVLMEQSEEFNIRTVDVFGSESTSQQLKINYGVESPLILLPGSIKTISDDTAISGSTPQNFVTLTGSFREDGIIISDMVLATSGKNIGEYREVVFVEDRYITTTPFPYTWESGDSIKIYPREDRPFMYTDGDKIDLSGKCNRNIAKVRYTTKELGPVKAYAKNTEDYTINTYNNNLLININGKLEFIILPSGELTAQDIANQVNNAFSSTFDYDVAFSDGERFYLKALHIDIFSGTANTTLGLVEGEVNFDLAIEVPDSIIFQNSAVGGADCSEDVVESGLLFCMNLDGVTVRFTFNTNTEYTKDDIISKINILAGKEVATNIGPNIVFNSATNLWVGDPLEDLNLEEQLSGNANFNNGLNLSTDITRNPDSIESGIGGSGDVGNGDEDGDGIPGYSGSAGVGTGDWNINLDIVQPSNVFTVYGLSEFYELSPPVSLNVEYRIKPPTINPAQSPVVKDFVDLGGTYNKSGAGVKVNGEEAGFAKSGRWIHQVQGLSTGDNTLLVVATDRFGRDSEAAEVVINFKDPADIGFPDSDDTIPLNWCSVSSPSFGPDAVKKAAEAIDSIFDPIIGVLDFVSGLLDIAKAFIVDNILGPIAALRAAIQALIDNITELLDRLVNGAGLYTLSTLPELADMKSGMNLESFFDHIKGSFPDFFRKIDSSFYDPLDANRPQLSKEATVGGMVLAIGDGAGVSDFIQAAKSLLELYNKQKMDYGLGTVNNLKAEGQNQRIVLTWTAPDGGSNMFPYDYIIKRTKTSGGKQKTHKIKTQLATSGKGNQYFEEIYYDPKTGRPEAEDYEVVGSITNNRVMKEYKFIDGRATQSEKTNEEGIDKVVSGTTDFFEAAREFVLVSTGSSEAPLNNGETWYYKVVPVAQGTDVVGQSPEVKAAAAFPELEERTEYLYDQIKKTKSGWYRVSGSLYDKDTAVFADDVNDLKVIVDGSSVVPTKINAERGLIFLPRPPQQTLEVTYWGRKIQKTTRASVVSLFPGPYTFTEEKNVMGVQVGAGATITETYGGTPITRTQNVTFTRFKKDEKTVTMSAEDVASVIRSQTSGLKVFVDRQNRIVLEEDQNPDIYRGSQLEITVTNPIVGFLAFKDLSDYQITEFTHTIDTAGPLGGTPPDWKAIRISDLFPEVNDLLRYINNTFDQLAKGLTSATNSLIDFIDLLQAKIDALSDMLKEAQDLLKKLAEGLTIQGGFYCLTVPANSGGTEYFSKAIRTSIGYPEDSEYAGGIVFLYTDGGTGVALDWIISSLS